MSIAVGEAARRWVLPPKSVATPRLVGISEQGYKETARERAKLLATIVRIEFDPAHLTKTPAEKALIAAIPIPRHLRHPEEREAYAVDRYTTLLHHAQYVTRRRSEMEAFESQMDVGTAVCLAQAALRDPQFAAIRRRLRQWDERKRTGGDQREQFGQLMAFLRGDTNQPPSGADKTEGDTHGESEGGVGSPDRDETDADDLSEPGEQEPGGLEYAGSAIPQWGEDEAGEE